MNTMKTTYRTWIAAAAVALAVAAPSFALPSGSLTLSGSIAAINDIVITPAPGIASLDLTVNQTDLLVATVNEKSNRRVGYTVTLASLAAAGLSGNPFFKGANGANTDVLSYSFKYGPAGSLAGFSLTSGSAIITSTSAKTGAAGVDKELRISYNGAAAFLNEDTYSDTLTLTIAPK
jgi:hypothetical protein